MWNLFTKPPFDVINLLLNRSKSRNCVSYEKEESRGCQIFYKQPTFDIGQAIFNDVSSVGVNLQISNKCVFIYLYNCD